MKACILSKVKDASPRLPINRRLSIIITKLSVIYTAY